MIARYTRSFIALAALLIISGCQSTREPTKPAHSALTDADLANISNSNAQPNPPSAGQPQSVEQALGTDPCSIRLSDVEGALVLYYAVNRELPPQLQNLKTESGDPIPLRCPLSTLPYQYSSLGLVSPGRSMRILVWDSTPVHNGFRYCILMSPSKPGELALDIKPIPEKLFATYQPTLHPIVPPSP